MSQFGIRQAMMLLRRRGQALGEHGDLAGKDRKLARLRAAQLAVDANDVAQIKALHQRPIISNLLLSDEKLNLARHIADVDELELALVAMQDDATGCADLWPRHFAGALIGKPLAEVEIRRQRKRGRGWQFLPRPAADTRFRLRGANLTDRRMVIEPRAPWIVSKLGDSSQLVATRRFPIAASRRACQWFGHRRAHS